MKGLLSLFLISVYSQSDINLAAGTTQKLKTIEEVVANSHEGVEFIDNAELIKRINANPKLILLDVREKYEYDGGHLKGATLVESGTAKYVLARTLRDVNAEIIVYCVKGNRSADVVKELKEMGYKNVKSHLGIEEWIRDGYTVHNYLGEIKVVKLRKVNAATNPVDYYQDKKQGKL